MTDSEIVEVGTIFSRGQVAFIYDSKNGTLVNFRSDNNGDLAYDEDGNLFQGTINRVRFVNDETASIIAEVTGLNLRVENFVVDGAFSATAL